MENNSIRLFVSKQNCEAHAIVIKKNFTTKELAVALHQKFPSVFPNEYIIKIKLTNKVVIVGSIEELFQDDYITVYYSDSDIVDEGKFIL